MGLFDRKRNAEPLPEPEPEPQPEPKVKPKPAAQKAAPPPEPTPAPAPAPQPESKPGYGIQNAIELMRQLPSDNVNLVVEVVKKTLESLNVDVQSIISDAERRHARIDDRLDSLQSEIREFEEEIEARRAEIGALTADRDETDMVRDRLVLALDITSKGGKPNAASESGNAGFPAAAWGSTKAASKVAAKT